MDQCIIIAMQWVIGIPCSGTLTNWLQLLTTSVISQLIQVRVVLSREHPSIVPDPISSSAYSSMANTNSEPCTHNNNWQDHWVHLQQMLTLCTNQSVHNACHPISNTPENPCDIYYRDHTDSMSIISKLGQVYNINSGCVYNQNITIRLQHQYNNMIASFQFLANF